MLELICVVLDLQEWGLWGDVKLWWLHRGGIRLSRRLLVPQPPRLIVVMASVDANTTGLPSRSLLVVARQEPHDLGWR